MNRGNELGNAAQTLFDADDVQGVLSDSFYAGAPLPLRRPKTLGPVVRPSHYKVICISLYTEDLGRLDGMVGELKRRGYTKANRSALIRHALAQVDLDAVPRGL
ncbi:MAG: hypothetical protein HY744_12205 [Deltaproteobacteria bacterium]|nr:hypothetical protein [Deltaproteobacteria bacterium]